MRDDSNNDMFNSAQQELSAEQSAATFIHLFIMFHFTEFFSLRRHVFCHYVSFKAASMKSKRSLEMLEIQNFSHTNLLSFGFCIKTNQAAHFCALVSSAGEGRE